jgi:hypothetical protein
MSIFLGANKAAQFCRKFRRTFFSGSFPSNFGRNCFGLADLFAQNFLRFLNNGENRCLGIKAFCFGLKQLFGNCSAIVRIVQKITLLRSSGKKAAGVSLVG